MNIKVVGISVLLVVLCAVMVSLAADTFLQPFNIENLLRRTALFGVISIGVAFVIITGGIDLSIGSLIALTGVLLAMFLQVQYEPFEQQRVYQVQANERAMVLEAGQTPKVGELVRYYGGRRAATMLATVTQVEETTFVTDEDGEVSAVRVVVDKPFSADDRMGWMTNVFAVEAFDVGTDVQPTDGGKVQARPRVTIAGDHGYLEARDQLTLVHPERGLKQSAIESVTVADGRTAVVLMRDVGPIDTNWLATPLERRQRMPIPMAVSLVMVIALGVGLLHGLLVTKLGLQSFVVTLCGLLFYRGIARWLVGDQTMGFGNEFDESLRPLATGEIPLGGEWGLPIPTVILLGLAVVAAVFLNKTVWGRYMLALGRNERAARYSGIETSRVTIMAYVICSGAAGVSGILFALDANSVAPSSHGNFFELYAIAAAVLGGCSLRGGEGTIFGVVIGAAVMRVLYNMITLLNISTTLEFAIIGAVILAGVIADELFKRYAARRRAIKAGWS